MIVQSKWLSNVTSAFGLVAKRIIGRPIFSILLLRQHWRVFEWDNIKSNSNRCSVRHLLLYTTFCCKYFTPERFIERVLHYVSLLSNCWNVTVQSKRLCQTWFRFWRKSVFARDSFNLLLSVTQYAIPALYIVIVKRAARWKFMQEFSEKWTQYISFQF